MVAGLFADDEWGDDLSVDGDAAVCRVGAAVGTKPGELLARIDLERPGRGGEDVGRKMRHVGVQHHQLRERVVLELGAEVEAGRARQVVEAVAVLQRLKLVLEHEVEAGAEQAAERHLLLGQAADPEVDIAETGGGDTVQVLGGMQQAVVRPAACAVQEVEAVGVGALITRPLGASPIGRSRWRMAAARFPSSVVSAVIEAACVP